MCFGNNHFDPKQRPGWRIRKIGHRKKDFYIWREIYTKLLTIKILRGGLLRIEVFLEEFCKKIYGEQKCAKQITIQCIRLNAGLLVPS
jgi:hypothetical protein